jgi:hypothetical protein
MKLPLVGATALILSAAPALAHNTPPDGDCYPQTTGSLPTQAQGPNAARDASVRVPAKPPEESWQEEFREDATRRQQRSDACEAE